MSQKFRGASTHSLWSVYEIKEELVNYLYLNEIISILNGVINNDFTALALLRKNIYNNF